MSAVLLHTTFDQVYLDSRVGDLAAIGNFTSLPFIPPAFLPLGAFLCAWDLRDCEPRCPLFYERPSSNITPGNTFGNSLLTKVLFWNCCSGQCLRSCSSLRTCTWVDLIHRRGKENVLDGSWEREREREKEREIGGEKRVVTNVKRQSRLVQIWPFFCAMPNWISRELEPSKWSLSWKKIGILRR